MPDGSHLIRDFDPSALARNAAAAGLPRPLPGEWGLDVDRAIEPYRGYEHGCFPRLSHACLGHSPGLDFDTEIAVKPDVAALLVRELSDRCYQPGALVLGSGTDPYQPVERTLRLTRAALEVLDRFGHPVTIVTGSAAVAHDRDLLRRMAARGLVRVLISIATLDPALARRLDPRASTPALRLRAIADLARAGIPVGILAAPMIPGLTDAELEPIVTQAVAAGACSADYVLLRIPHELDGTVATWLREQMPGRDRRVLSLIRNTRADAPSSDTGPHADPLAQRLARLRRHHRLEARQPLDYAHFHPSTWTQPQLALS